MKVKSNEKYYFIGGTYFKCHGYLWKVKESFVEKWNIFRKCNMKYFLTRFEKICAEKDILKYNKGNKNESNT